MREAEMADLKQSFDEVRQAASGFSKGTLITSLQKDVTNALRIDDAEKPMDAQAAPTSDTPTSDTAVADTAVASVGEEPATPTTPAQPTPETFLEAADHPSAGEPLAITPESTPQNTGSTEPDVLKDARAS
jgi:sec-independent protein translocase protein TatB